MTNPELTAHLYGQTDPQPRDASLLALNDQQPCLSDLPLADSPAPQPERALLEGLAKTPAQIRAEWEAIETNRSGDRFDTVLTDLLAADAEGKTTELESRLISVINTLNGAVGSYHVEMGILLDAHAATQTELDRLLADSPTPQPEQGWRPAEVTPAMQRIAAGYRLAAEQQPEQELSTEQVRELLDGITSGEWNTSREDLDSFACREDDEVDHVVYIYRNPSERVPVFGGELDNARADAALMAAAPTLARNLITEREAHAATRAQNDRLRAALAEAEARIGRAKALVRAWVAEAAQDGPVDYESWEAADAAKVAQSDCAAELRAALATAQEVRE